MNAPAKVLHRLLAASLLLAVAGEAAATNAVVAPPNARSRTQSRFLPGSHRPSRGSQVALVAG